MKDKQNIEKRDYGFTEIKSVYKKNLSKGLIYAIALHVVILGVYLVSSYFNRTEAVENFHRDTIVILDLDEFKTAEKEIVKTEEPLQEVTEVVKTIKDLAALEPVPVKQNDADNSVIKTQTELDNTGNNVGREGDLTGQYSDNSNTNTTQTTEIEKEIEKETVDLTKDFNTAEVTVSPECVNLGQVKSMMRYPELAREAGTEGKVTIKVLVGPDGSVIKTGKLTGPDIFHDEVKEKARELQFRPGLMNNTAVRVWVTVPFNFKLQ